MEKSVFSHDYALLVQLLRELRTEVGVTQEELAERVGQTQSFVSKCERMERRLDVIELRAWCFALGATLAEFITRYDARIAEGQGSK